MDFLDTIVNLLINHDFSVAWAMISALLGYVIYYQNRICKDLTEQKEELSKVLSEYKYTQNKIEEDLENLRLTLKEEITPVIRKMEIDLEDINRVLEDAKVDQRSWFASLKDDFNQFRSEFRDILKLVLNGRKSNH